MGPRGRTHMSETAVHACRGFHDPNADPYYHLLAVSACFGSYPIYPPHVSNRRERWEPETELLTLGG